MPRAWHARRAASTALGEQQARSVSRAFGSIQRRSVTPTALGPGAEQRDRAVDAAAHRDGGAPGIGAARRRRARSRWRARRWRASPGHGRGLEQRQPGEVALEPGRVGGDDPLPVDAQPDGGPLAVTRGIAEELLHAASVATARPAQDLLGGRMAVGRGGSVGRRTDVLGKLSRWSPARRPPLSGPVVGRAGVQERQRGGREGGGHGRHRDRPARRARRAAVREHDRRARALQRPPRLAARALPGAPRRRLAHAARARRGAPGSASATRASGSSSRRSPGFLEVEDAASRPTRGASGSRPSTPRCSRIRTSPAHVAPFAPLRRRRRRARCRTCVDAYRSGDGVPYELYGADFRDGQGLINRPTFNAEMADWLASSPDDPRAAVERRRARRRRRLRAGLLDRRDRARVSRTCASTGSTSTSRRSPTRSAVRGGHRGRRPRLVRRRSTAARSSGEHEVRPRLHLRGAARHVAAGRGARRRPRGARARRLGARRRRARRGVVHGAGRPGRADHVRLERRPLPAGRAGRAAVGRARDGAARGARCARSPPRPASPRSRCCRSRTTSSASTGSCPRTRAASLDHLGLVSDFTKSRASLRLLSVATCLPWLGRS